MRNGQPRPGEQRYGKARDGRREKLKKPLPGRIELEEFYAYMPMHKYIYTPSRELWPGSSINNRIPPIDTGQVDDKGKPIKISASVWLDQHRPVEQMTWAPGEPMLIEGRLVSQGGWIKKNGVHTFNLYRAPIVELGDPEKAGKWRDHIQTIYGSDQHHIEQWCAHRVQKPQEKINHGLVLGGLQGIGKDTIMEPVKYAIGPWNFEEVTPMQIIGRFNGFLKSVILRISEGRDLGEVNRYALYEHTKNYMAAPPDVLRVDEKNIREHSVFNCCGVVITTNHKTDGLYLPADDRRHYVAWSDCTKDDFTDTYWNDFYGWYHKESGIWHVAAFLRQLDISTFNSKAPPPKTEAFWDIVNSNRAPEDAELADILDLLGNPDATMLKKVIDAAKSAGRQNFAEWLEDRKNRRVIGFRFENCKYVAVRNPAADDGLWSINRERQVVYAKRDLPLRDQIDAAGKL